jgi:hypothetical protein
MKRACGPKIKCFASYPLSPDSAVQRQSPAAAHATIRAAGAQLKPAQPPDAGITRGGFILVFSRATAPTVVASSDMFEYSRRNKPR